MKFWKLVSVATTLVLSTSVNAALIDNDTYTMDDVSGLDWLDLSATDGLAYNSVLSLNPGWRYATYDEVSVLYSTLFEGIYDTGTGTGVSDGNASHYDDQWVDANMHIDLFGVTYTDTPVTFYVSYGWYLHSDGTLRTGGATVNVDTGNSLIYFAHDTDYSQFIDTGYETYGTYLVRTSVVPLPAAVWLFGSGLIGLIGLARRKTHS